MDAATTAPKQYNKTKFQNNQRRNQTSNNITALSTKKQNSANNNNNNNSNNNANNLRTYRANDVEAGGSNEKNTSNTIMKTQKQATKQGRAAKTNVAATTTTETTTTTITTPTLTTATVGKEKEQKTAIKTNTHTTTTTTSTATTNGQTNKSDLVSNNRFANISSTNSSSTNNNNNNNNLNSDNSNSLIENKQQQTQYELNKTKSNNNNSDSSNNDNNKMLSNALTTTPAANSLETNDDDSWNNSKYLHKKFKRLASTTDIDGNATSIDESNSDAASKARTTSLSSASSSISSPPPSSSKSQATLTNGYHHHHHSHHQIDAHVAHSANAQMPPVNVVNAIVNINNNNNNSNQKENTKYNLNSDNNNSIMLLATPNVASNNNQQLTHTETLVTDNVAANCTSVNQTDASASAAVAAAANSAATTSVGRHVCPYCNLNCTKPSVLQKHIRAHTNERPFPCDICKIAFKTKSNYYKHCRSRSHAARSRGIEVPVEADETFSDQELSNSSSEVISRTDSPLDERSVPSPTILPAHIQQSQQSQHLQQPAIVLTHTQTPIASPSTLSATRTTYLQRPLQPQQLPLGSPAAGTLPSTVTTATMPQQNCSNNCATVVNINVQSKQQSLDFKPYKPKFHNAALYATTKDSNSSNLAIKQQNQTSLNSKAEHNEHLTGLQQQQPPTQAPTHPPPTPPHHASLSPVTHMKLNNHLNAQHQLQLQQHQQQQQQHILAPPLPPSNVANTAVAMPTPAGVYFLGQPPNTAALMHPGAATTHMAQQYYDPLAAAVAHQQALAYHMLTPHEQQFHHQYQMQQHHLQLQYQQEHQRQQQQQLPSSSSSATSVIKSHATQATIVSTSVQAVAQQRGNKTNSSQILTNGTPSTGNNNSTTASLIHGGVAGVASSGVHLNKEFLQEHISKLISQNEAIVENKELLLQKKYPKTLNRSRSFNNNTNNNGNSNSSNTSSSTITNSNLVTTTTINSESANAKLAQAIAQKKQMQMHQQQTIVQQQHIQYQQQQHQHLIDEVSTPQPQSHYPINGLSKQLQNTKQQIATATMQPQYRQQQNSTLATPQHVSPTLQLQSQHMIKEVLPMSLTNQSSYNTSPLNLSAKPKVKEIITSASSPAPTTASPSAPPTPKKRKSIEHQASTSSEASTSSVASSSTNNVSSVTANVNKPTQNTSIIKNILLNARGLAQPTGEGEHAVYVCPLCSLECRTAEDLQTHTGSYCHGSTNSAPITPIASPSHKYFRSGLNPLSLAKLSLAKLAWSQLKTKPSNGVLNRLSASQSSSSSKTTTTVTQTTTSAPSTLSIEHPFRLIDTPLPSPGPLLGKTPLVDSYNNNETQRKPENDVIITKMHEDRHQFTADHLPTSSKRTRYEASTSDCFTLTPPPSGLLMTANKRATGLSGGDIQPLNTLPNSNEIKKDERIKRFTSSGGSMIPISECSDLDKSPKLIRTPLLSGGSFQEVSPKKDKDGKNERLTICTPNIGGLTNVLGLPNSNAPQHFQFPPIVPITAFNPLTLPPLQTMTQAEKTIPYVPGIPGPNTPHTPLLPPPPQHLQLPQVAPPRNISPNRKSSTNAAIDINVKASNDLKNLSPFGGVQNVPSEFSRVPPSPALRNVRNWTPNSNLIKPAATMDATKKSFNFQRMADNLSQGKTNNATFTKSSPPEKERRHFNFDALAKEHDLNIQTAPPVTNRTNAVTSPLMPLHVDTTIAATSEQAPPTSSDLELKKSKFLRPTSLPLKPGTFTPKRHHGITPTANTLPLISPETPRPSKSCVQLYLNGHAYTYLGLKCSTKMFYCTVNCPQPSYVAGMHKLSMYSVWQVCAENNPHPLGLKPKEVMSLYDSRQKSAHATMAETLKSHYRLVTSQQTVMTPFADGTVPYIHHQIKQIASNEPLANEQIKKEFNENLSLNKDYMPPVSNVSTAAATTTAASQLVGGYESYEDYTYIRGRGRGRYVCSECGIRCKKPSMLKKHIRTHTDVRPYTCKHCNFSFKTKGNLTKHMQSKTHYKKCIELGINPGPMPADGEFQEPDMDCDQQSTTSAGGRTSSIPGESDSEDYSDNESESSGEFQEEQQKFNKKTYSNQTQLYTDNDESKSRLQEHEAARCLLSLSMTPPITQSVSPQLKTDGVSNYQSFNNEQTAAVFTTAPQQTSSTQQTSTIKRVVSFTQPKPPFDYQKQEQYYSNPEESKPKRNANANATTIYESAPIDLTKPRPNSTPAVPIKKEISTIVTTQTTTPTLDIVSIPGPVQTKAQIRDVIFGKSNNESGFLKTLISVSDKVRTSAENAENAKNIKENVLLQNYLKEQALQYHKIKQSQMSRNNFSTLEGNHQPLMHQSQCATPPVFTMSTTTNLGTPISSVLTVSSPVVVIPQITATAFKQEINRKSPEIKEQPQCLLSLKPESEIIKITEASKPIAAKQAHIDENESASDTEINATAKQTNKPISPIPEPYNANLPAAVHQPGTTDFSGVLSSTQPHTVTVGEDGFKKNTTNNNEVQPVFPRSTPVTSEGRPVCSVCFKSFQKQHQLTLHMNIHYMERRFRCEPCGVSFRTQGHFQKHERSEQHKSKVAMNSTFGKPSTSNPRPFECTDCKIAFRIHGHLAKHLRSKGHVQKLECLLKLPIGTYAEIERAGISLTEIDTSDCENSLISLKQLAQKLMEKDPTKLGNYSTSTAMNTNDNNSNTGIGSQDSASEDDGFSAAASAAASAIASLENDSPADTPRRANSTSEDESIAAGLNNLNNLGSGLKRRLPNSFSNGEESDNQLESLEMKRTRKTENTTPPVTSAGDAGAATLTPTSSVAN